MPEIANDFRELLPGKEASAEPDERPIEYLWIYDPQEAKVYVENGEGDPDHPAHFPTHKTMATHIHHPDRLEGYAYPITGGYRIVDNHHHKVEDPFILKSILAALRKEHPVTLPSIRYHGDPAGG